MVETGRQESLDIDVPRINKHTKERQKRVKKEFPSDHRVLIKGSSVYLDPNDDSLPIGKVSKAGYVQDLGKSGFLNQFRPINQITLETTDGIPVILIPDNTAFTFPSRLIKPK